MVLLFRDFYEKQYKVPMCSGVTCIWLLFFVMTLVAPWILCWRAGGKFFTKQVTFKHDAQIMTPFLFFLAFRLLG